MPFKRTNSMPEARHLLASSFPMRVSELNDLHPLHEHDEHDEYDYEYGERELLPTTSTTSISSMKKTASRNGSSLGLGLGLQLHMSKPSLSDMNNSMGHQTMTDNDRTEETVDEEDDYGFFPMDEDDDDDYGGEYGDLSGGGQAQDDKLEQEREQQQEQHKEDQRRALQEDKDNENDNDVGVGVGFADVDATSSTTTRRSSAATRKKKSALRRGSAYGDSEEGIPLDFEQKEFNRVLPKPDLSQRPTSDPPKKGLLVRRPSRGMFRVSSEPVFVRPVYQPEEHHHNEHHNEDEHKHEQETENEMDRSDGSGSGSTSSSFVEGAMKRRISFGTIQIREHTQTIGDNPSCTYGTPVQLDWDHKDLEVQPCVIEYDDYKTNNDKSRTKREFHMNHFQRDRLLKKNGFSTNEIKAQKKKVTKSRNQRERTKFMVLNYPQLASVEDAIESSVRKMKRSVSKSKLNKIDYDNDSSIVRDDLCLSSLTSTSPRSSKTTLLSTMDNDISTASAPAF